MTSKINKIKCFYLFTPNIYFFLILILFHIFIFYKFCTEFMWGEVLESSPPGYLPKLDDVNEYIHKIFRSL